MIRGFADVSANERTFLAWVRTAIAVVGFGLAAARLGPSPSDVRSGAALLGAGGLVVVLAWFRMRRLHALILDDAIREPHGVASDALLVALVIALLAMLGVFALHVY